MWRHGRHHQPREAQVPAFSMSELLADVRAVADLSDAQAKRTAGELQLVAAGSIDEPQRPDPGRDDFAREAPRLQS